MTPQSFAFGWIHVKFPDVVRWHSILSVVAGEERA